MGKCKAKSIQTYLDIFRHNQAYTGIIQAYSGILKPCVNLAYFEPWHNQNPDICRKRRICRTLAYL